MAYTVRQVSILPRVIVEMYDNISTGYTVTPVIQRPASQAGTTYAYSATAGAGQANKAAIVKVDLAGSAQTLDLTAIANATGSTSFSYIKGFSIESLATNSGHTCTVGNAASNSWQGPLSASATYTLQAGGQWTDHRPLSTDGWVVDSSNKNLKLDPGANTFSVVVVLWGE